MGTLGTPDVLGPMRIGGSEIPETEEVHEAIVDYMQEKKVEGFLKTTLERLQRMEVDKNPLSAQRAFLTVTALYRGGNLEQKQKIALLGIALNKAIPENVSFFSSMVDAFQSVVTPEEISKAEQLVQQVFKKEEKIAQEGKVTQAIKAVMGKVSSAKQKIAKAITSRSVKVKKPSEEGTEAKEIKEKKSSRIFGKLTSRARRSEVKEANVEEHPWWQALNAQEKVRYRFSSLISERAKENDELIPDLYASGQLREGLIKNPELMKVALETTLSVLERANDPRFKTASVDNLIKPILITLRDMCVMNPEMNIDKELLERAKKATETPRPIPKAPATAEEVMQRFDCLSTKTKEREQGDLIRDLYARGSLRQALTTKPKLLEAALGATSKALEMAKKPNSETASFLPTINEILKNLKDISQPQN